MNIKAFLSLLAVIVLVTTIYTKSSAKELVNTTNYPKINGVQVFVLDPSYAGDLDRFFQEIKTLGIDTVFFRVFHNQSDRAHLGLELACPSGVYFQTDETCVVNDLLPDVIVAAKKQQIKVYAWMATRSLTYLKTDDNLSLAFSPDKTIINGYGANIFKANVSGSIVNIFTDLARYDIDGILFQDDFIIKYSEGADYITRSLFESETGFASTPTSFFRGIKEFNGKLTFTGYQSTFYIWSLWKHEHLMRLFGTIKKSIRKVNPNIMLAANIYYETPMETDKGLAWYGQSIKGLLDAGADYFAIMGYVEQIADEKQLDNAQAADYIAQITKKTMYYVKDYARIMIKLQGRSFKTGRAIIDPELSALVCKELSKLKGISMSLVPVNSASDIMNQCL